MNHLIYTIPTMSQTFRCAVSCLLLLLFVTPAWAFASAYNGRPKLIVIIVIDQFRADYLEKYHDRFVPGGFRLLMDRGADFTDCYYEYAITMTAPGHATLGTGAYSDGHGINNNEWWDTARKRVVTSVQDTNTKMVGVSTTEEGASPHNLLADTLGDELRLATGGKSRIFGTSLKERAAILPVGFSANGAYWLDRNSGAFETSTFYMPQLPEWAQRFNANKSFEKYWNLEWKVGEKVLRTTAKKDAKGLPLSFYDAVGPTPYANDYQLEFARELVTNEKLGSGETTDLLVISLSAFDILGHKVGPESPEMEAMTLALDKQLADFFSFLGRQVGLANTWIALSADHGAAPMPEYARSMRLPAARFDEKTLAATLNPLISTAVGKQGDYVKFVGWPGVYLSEESFTAAGKSEVEAERIAGEAIVRTTGARGYFGKAQLATNSNIENSQLGRRYLHSYSPLGSWYVLVVPPIMLTPYPAPTTEHYSPYNYNTHVPLLLYGLPFQPGTYRTHAEPVDLAVTLASLLGINKPSHAVGRVLTEAIRERAAETDGEKAAR
jgi:hypothetical protein